MKNKNMKRGSKISVAAGSASGVGSIISVHNVCHYLCLGVVAVLSVFGILVSSDVLMFLENYNLIFWSMGLLFLFVSIFLLYNFPNCISKKAITANAGLLVFGFPFQIYNFLFWIAGSVVLVATIGWYIRDRVIR